MGGGGWRSMLGMANGYETREKITSPYSESGWVHACLRPIANAVASVPLQLWIGDPSEDKNARLVTSKDSPLVALFDRPNPWQTMSQFFEAGAIHRKLDGEDFWFLIDLNGKPMPFALLGQATVPVFIVPVRGGLVVPILNGIGVPTAWCFTMGGTLITAPPSAVVQFKDYDPDDPIRGLGDVDACLSDIDLEWQATRYQRAILKHSGDPGGQILIDAPLAADEANATENEANEKLSVDNAGRWTVLAGQGVEYKANKLSPKDMEFRTLQAWIRDKIAGVLGVPLPIIGVLEQATYSNMEQCIELFWKGGNGICSYLRSVEDGINKLFLPRLAEPLASKMVARFDLRKIKALQDDKSGLYELAAKLAGMNIGLSLDEAMQLVGLETDVSKMPFSGTRLVSGTLVPIQAIAGEDGQGLPVDAPADPNADPTLAAGAATPVQDTALNGAQISSLLEVVAAVSDGTLSPEGAVALILAAFPGIDEAEAKKIVAGINEKPPEPAPAPGAPPPPAGDAPAADPPQPEDDEGKDLEPAGEAATREQAPSERDAAEEAFAERREYWKAHEKATLAPGEASLKKVYLGKKGWRRKYEAAQLARIRAYAETGKGLDTAPATKSDELGGEQPPRHVTVAEVEKLLIDRSEWSQKMQTAFEPHLRSIFNISLQDMAEELGADLLAPTDPRVLSFLNTQLLKLAEGHTSSLADRVRGVLVEELSKASSTGDLQSALVEVLPELTDALKGSFSDREGRALTIARTETAKASNGARFMQMQDAGVDETEWVTSGDAAVRGTPGGPYEDSEFSHFSLDGKTAPVGQEFDHASNPGLKYPSDPDAPAGTTINCRCASRAVQKD
jgi:HK97 family phage portal protein